MITYSVVGTGQVLDRFAVDQAGNLQFATGAARQLVSTFVDRMGQQDALELLASWSNGYLQTQDEASATLVARLSNQAPPADPALAQVQAEWEAALAGLLEDWRTQVTPQQRQAIRDQVAAAVASGNVAALAAMSLPTAGAAQLLADALADLYDTSGERMAAELAAQGAPVVVPPPPDAEVLSQVATGVALLLAAGLAQAAAREALRAFTPGVAVATVVSAVDAALDGLSGRGLTDQLGGALSRAQNMGRLMTGRQLELDLGGTPGDPEDPAGPADDGYVPQVIYSSTEKMDTNTCPPCWDVDGTVYGSWIEAWVDYGGGVYRGCEGGLRCRGTVKARWNPAAGA